MPNQPDPAVQLIVLLVLMLMLFSIIGWMTGRLAGARTNPFWLLKGILKAIRSILSHILIEIGRAIKP